MNYFLEFTLHGLPSTTNSSGRKHWAVKAKEARAWNDRVVYEVMRQKKFPPRPLRKARLTLTRFSSGKLDFDGLVSSFKSTIDGLVVAKVIENDSMDVIGIPEYRHEKAAPREGKIKVLVELPKIQLESDNGIVGR